MSFDGRRVESSLSGKIFYAAAPQEEGWMQGFANLACTIGKQAGKTFVSGATSSRD
jgi:hypothetical protein